LYLLTADGHFDGESIIRNCEELKRAVQGLRTPAKARKEALTQSMKFHEFNFDLARELEWIAEKRSILNSTGDIQTLQQVGINTESYVGLLILYWSTSHLYRFTHTLTFTNFRNSMYTSWRSA
jgi:hypothetical protein